MKFYKFIIVVHNDQTYYKIIAHSLHDYLREKKLEELYQVLKKIMITDDDCTI